ncbi:MAG: C40 family peptidase [Deltaproteobacteria bacterium]|jgi:cell wall-associated NlpC family hydrolase|nr:C40 family peptidase [Deltaproteobacteria bacterium]
MRKYSPQSLTLALLLGATLFWGGCGPKTQGVSPLALKVTQSAHSYLGTPYVYGGKSPKGFDCSGLVWYVFRLHGISLPDSSWKQANAGVKVSRDEMLPGDLVFFQSRGRVDHVGVYIGEGWMIHAPGRGKKVRKANLEEKYYRQRFATARRVI